ncbi:MAG: heme o synthase [Gemmatimonadota bacterium]
MRRALRDYATLCKPRINALVLVTTAVGYVVAARGQAQWALLAWTLAGTALAAGGASALNQYVERDADGRMRRTAGRPLPAGRMAPARALAFGLTLAVTGVVLLVLKVNATVAFLGLATVVLYVAVYTPLKRRTGLCTLVGAVPGAIPPMMGYAAATGVVDAGAWALFGILFLWQLPHFLAIAWLYRDDYARAGFPMLPVGDPDGAATGRQIALYSLALIPVSLVPTLLGMTGGLYFFGALGLGLLFLAAGLAMALERARPNARRLLLASVAYLPALLALLLADISR